jgi:hypothetical protein
VTRWLFILLAVALAWFSTASNAHAHKLASQSAYDAGAPVEKVVLVAGITMDTTEGNNEAPVSLHRYLYCSDNPANRIDPSGHDDGCDSAVVASKFLGQMVALGVPVTVPAMLAAISYSSTYVYISVDPNNASSYFDPSMVQSLLKTQLSAIVFDNLPAGQSLNIVIHKESAAPSIYGWTGTPKHTYVNRVEWNLNVGIASSGGVIGGPSQGITRIKPEGVETYCQDHGGNPTTQTWVNILAHEVIWLNAGGHFDHDVDGSSDISNGKGFPAFAPFTITAPERLNLRSKFGF